MPISVEIKPGGAGFGQRRFVVRGRIVAPEEQIVGLRALYNEYPERFPVAPQFPQPGRRGPSRPREPASAPVPVFPPDRPRTVRDLPPNLGNAPYDLPASIDLLDGDSMVVTPLVGAGATTIVLSNIITRPFMITQYSYWADIATPLGSSGVQGTIKVSSDRINTGGFLTSGIPIGSVGPEQIQFEPFRETQTHPTTFLWWTVPGTIKVILLNNTAGGLETYVVVNWRYLDANRAA